LEPFIISLFICLLFTPFVIRFANRRKWFDVPDDRKLHSVEIPRLGGVAIMGSMMITILLVAGPDSLLNIRYFLAGLLILFFVGLWDDLQPVKPIIKLAGEIIPIVLLTYSARIPLHEILATENAWLIGLEWPFTMFLAFWVINSFNLIDGINGLAGTIGFISLFAAGWMMEGGFPSGVATLCYAMAGALLAFLFFNFVKPKIFMGDCGSLLIGYCLVYVLTQTKIAGYHELNPRIWIFYVFPFISIPLFDMARVFFIRISKAKNPFHGDRNHLHHLLLETGMTHIGATLSLTVLTIANVALVIFVSEYTFNIIFLFLVNGILPMVFTSFLWMKVKKLRDSHQIKTV